MAGGAETPNIAALPAIVLIGAGSGRRSAREAIDLSNDGGVTLGRLFTQSSTLSLYCTPKRVKSSPIFAWIVFAAEISLSLPALSPFLSLASPRP